MTHLLQISDLHFLRTYPESEAAHLQLLREGSSLARRFEDCARALRGVSLDGILLTGDLTDYGDAEDYLFLRRYLSQYFPGVPVAATPGNHDVKEAFCTGFADCPASSQPFDACFALPDMGVISLDSSRSETNDGLIDEAQCEWLSDRLKDFSGRPAILITHFHLFEGQHTMSCAAYPERFKTLIAESGLCGIFCGHTHTVYNGYFAGKPYFTAPGFSFHAYHTPDGELVFAPSFGFCLYSFQGETLRSWQTYLRFDPPRAQ